MTYLLERLGFGASEKIIGANAFEWKVMSRYKKPAILDVADAADRARRLRGQCVRPHPDQSGRPYRGRRAAGLRAPGTGGVPGHGPLGRSRTAAALIILK